MFWELLIALGLRRPNNSTPHVLLQGALLDKLLQVGQQQRVSDAVSGLAAVFHVCVGSVFDKGASPGIEAHALDRHVLTEIIVM